MNVIVVLVGWPLYGSPQNVAFRFARHRRLPMPVVADVDGSVAKKYCDQPLRTPFSILLDEQGIVRLISDGYGIGENSLVHDVERLLNGEANRFAGLPVRDSPLEKPVPDGDLWVEGHRVKLSDLWSKRPLVLTFLLRHCEASDRRLRFIERVLGGAASINVVYVYPSRSDAEIARQTLSVRGTIAADDRRTVHAAYRVWGAPATFLIKKGRLYYASRALNDGSDTTELERALRSNEFLAQDRAEDNRDQVKDVEVEG